METSELLQYDHIRKFMELNTKYCEKKVRIPCYSVLCRFNKDSGCNKTFAYHPLFIEGKCQSFEYDT